MIVTTQEDSSAWSGALDVMLTAMAEAGRKASLKGAEEIRDVARAELTAEWHGPYTDTPSAPGEPPAAISGDLAASMYAAMETPDEAWVGPTAGYGRSGDYARIQELGGPMHGHPLMIWHRQFEGAMHRITAEFVELMPRPYLEPATEAVVDSGRLTDIYVEYWTAALEASVG